MPTTSPSDAHKLASLIKDLRIAILITGDPSDLHGRPMYTQPTDPDAFDGTLYFLSDNAGRKIRDIRDHQHVILTYSDDGKNRYVIVRGRAEASRDPARAREFWNIHSKGQWPEGPDSQRLAVIRVHVEDAEYWDGPSNARYMLSLAKARLTGERIQAESHHDTVRLG